MKCPVCGDSIQSGRCVFCGYRPTEADQEAAERYARQKASLTGGPETKPLKRTKQAPAAASRASPKPAAQKPVPVKRPGKMKPETRPSAKAPEKPKPKPKRAASDDAGQRPGRFKRLLFKLIVIAWFALYIGLIIGQLVHNAQQTAPEEPVVSVSDDADGLK